MLTIVVPTYNRLESLRTLIDALKAQTVSPNEFELIIVDDGSNDGTKEFLTEIRNTADFSLQCFHQANKGPATARNLGIKRAQGEIIIFTDDDCIPDPDWLECIRCFFETHLDFTGCGGRIKRQNDSRISRYIDRCGAMRHPVRKDGTVSYLVTANAAYRRSILEDLGGFREDINWPGGEDPDLSYRVIQAGGRLGYCAEAVIRHQHRDSLVGVYRMFFNHGRGGAVNAHWTSGSGGGPWKCFREYFAMAVSSSRSSHLALCDKATTLCCGIVRAVGFSCGLAYQQRIRPVPDSPAL